MKDKKKKKRVLSPGQGHQSLDEDVLEQADADKNTSFRPMKINVFPLCNFKEPK